MLLTSKSNSELTKALISLIPLIKSTPPSPYFNKRTIMFHPKTKVLSLTLFLDNFTSEQHHTRNLVPGLWIFQNGWRRIEDWACHCVWPSRCKPSNRPWDQSAPQAGSSPCTSPQNHCNSAPSHSPSLFHPQFWYPYFASPSLWNFTDSGNLYL